MHDHLLDLLLAGTAGTDERTLHERVHEVAHSDVVRGRREADHAARVPHQNGRSRVAVGRPQLFDDHHVRFDRAEHRTHLVEQIAEATLERERRGRSNDAGLDETHPARVGLNRSVAGHAQARVDPEDPHYWVARAAGLAGAEAAGAAGAADWAGAAAPSLK